jgi:excisionase family DNA binding protein
MSSEAAGDPRILTTKQAAELIKTTEAYVIRSIGRGVMPASRIGSEWRYWKPLILARILRTTDPTPSATPDDAEPPDVVTAAELAVLLQLGAHTVGQRIADGSIPAAKVGKRWLIHWPTIRGTLEQGEDFTPR